MADNSTTIGGRLLAVRGARSQMAFAKELGVHKNTLGSYERGERTPDVSFLQRLAKQGFDMNWFVTGDGDMWLSKASRVASLGSSDMLGVKELVAGYGDEWVWISKLDSVSGNAVVSSVPQSEATIALRNRWLSQKKLPSNALLAVEVEGDAMQPEIKEGALLLVDTAQRRLSSDSLYVMRSQGYTLAKRIQRLTDGSIRLSCDNSAYEDEVVIAAEVAQLEVVGRVVWVGQGV